MRAAIHTTTRMMFLRRPHTGHHTRPARKGGDQRAKRRPALGCGRRVEYNPLSRKSVITASVGAPDRSLRPILPRLHIRSRVAFEVVVLAYAAFFVIAAPLTDAPRVRRARVALTAGMLAVAMTIAMRWLPVGARLWLPLVYLPLGYWLPAPLVPAQSE